MTELWNHLNQPFYWGLALGLLLTFFTWKSAFSAKRNLKREIKRLHSESSNFQGHLNTQLKVNAEGNESLQKKLTELQEQNENLRINVNTLQQKPGRAELKQLQIMESAASQMREQAPGFAQAWEQALKKAEGDHDSADGGLRRLVRKVIPSLSHNPTNSDNTSEEIGVMEKEKA